MTRITQKQIETIVRLFKGGSTIHNLADGYQVDVARIQEIIREAMKPPVKA